MSGLQVAVSPPNSRARLAGIGKFNVPVGQPRFWHIAFCPNRFDKCHLRLFNPPIFWGVGLVIRFVTAPIVARQTTCNKIFLSISSALGCRHNMIYGGHVRMAIAFVQFQWVNQKNATIMAQPIVAIPNL